MVMRSIAAFDIPYAINPGYACRPAADETLMIAPARRAFIPSATSCVACSAARRFTAMMRS